MWYNKLKMQLEYVSQRACDRREVEKPSPSQLEARLVLSNLMKKMRASLYSSNRAGYRNAMMKVNVRGLRLNY